MEDVLIVSGTNKGRDFVEELLSTGIKPHTTLARSGSEARRLLIEASYDLIVINAPLKDEFGHEIALNAAETTTSGVMLIVKSEIADEVSDKVEDYGVLVIPKPVGRSFFYQSLKLALATKNRLSTLAIENTRLHKRINEIRLVDRAKCVLIQYLNMTEPQAHRYIEKQAMDMRKTKIEIAQTILNAYEP